VTGVDTQTLLPAPARVSDPLEVPLSAREGSKYGCLAYVYSLWLTLRTASRHPVGLGPLTLAMEHAC
jgi:hypothetical protein